MIGRELFTRWVIEVYVVLYSIVCLFAPLIQWLKDILWNWQFILCYFQTQKKDAKGKGGAKKGATAPGEIPTETILSVSLSFAWYIWCWKISYVTIKEVVIGNKIIQVGRGRDKES